MLHPDVLVIGTGRSGTSTVARLLHTRLGVCMGHSFRDPMEMSPQGDWEDSIIALASRRLVRGYPFPGSPRTDEGSCRRWLQAFSKAHARRGQPLQPQRRAPQCKAQLIGGKSPHLSALDAHGWRRLRPKLIVRTWRPKDLVVASMNRWRGSHVDWGRFYDERERWMSETLTLELLGDLGANYGLISFGEERASDESVLEQLEPLVANLDGHTVE